MNNLVKIFTSMALVLSLASCNQDNEANIYSPEAPQVSFYSTVMNYGLTPAQNNVISLPVTRTHKGSAASLGEFTLDAVYQVINGKSTDITSQNLFTLKSSQAVFADNSGEGKLEFSYEDINALNASAVYKLHVSNKSSEISPSKITQTVLSAQRVLTYAPLEGMAKVTSKWTNAEGLPEWTCKVEKAQEAEFYKLKDFYTPGGDIIFSVGTDNSVSVARQKDGEVHSSYGDIYVETDPTVASVKVGKTVTLYLKMTVAAGSFGTFKEVVELP
ncbi:MAG: hypothetical protein ACRC9Q_07120 [Bacteroidales bacterium]